MRFFKTLLAIFLFIVGPIGEMIKDVLKTKIFEFFNFHPENISMSILFITSTAIGAFILGTEWHDWFKPITKFRWFLSLKIKQGKKIIKEENNGMPDKHQTDRLRLRHSRWYDTIRGAYRNAFRGSIDGLKVEAFSDKDILNTFSDHKEIISQLVQNIAMIELMKNNVKSDWFHKEFNSEVLEEYVNEE